MCVYVCIQNGIDVSIDTVTVAKINLLCVGVSTQCLHALETCKARPF